MKIEEAVNELDNMQEYVEENWEEEEKISRFSDAVETVKIAISKGRIVGKMEIGGKQYIISEGEK